MSRFERIFCFIVNTFFAFGLITTMSYLGKTIGFEQMEELGVSLIFGAAYMHLAWLDSKKRDKEKEKDGTD